jgi:hypothetical protein
MFATFKKLFGKKVEIAIDSPTDFQPGALPPITRQRVDLQQRPAASVANPALPESIGIPLKSVLSRLPETLMQRVRQMDVGEAEIFIPTAKIISQIAKGAVKISFGELRQMGPPGTFTPENDRDRMLVELPLQDILSRLDPALLSRRAVQKHIEVPPEVTGPFGGQTKVSFATSMLKASAANQAVPVARSEPAPVPVTPVRPAAPIAPVAPVRPVAPAAPVRPVTPAQPAPRFQPQITRQPAQPAPAFQPIVARVRPAAPV